MQKAYSKRNWKNRPNTGTPLGESNLAPMDNAIDEIDNRVVAYDTTKANQSDLLTAFKAVSFNSSTGVFTFTKFNDTTVTVDTNIEKIAVNFDYDDDPTSAHYQNLIITLDDGTVKYVDMSALITEYEFSDSSTIHFSVTSGVVSANVINGSITADHLAPSVMAGINSAVASAEDSAEDSEAWAVGQRDGTDVPSTDETYHNNSKYYSGLSEDSAEDSEAYAIGKRGGTDVPSTDPTYHNNAKYYAEQAEQAVAISAFGTTTWGGISNDIFIATMTDADYVPSNGDLIALNFNTNFEAYTDYLQIRIHNVNYHVKVNGVEVRNIVPVLTYVLAGYSGIFYFDGTYLNLVNVSGGIKNIGYSGTRVSARNTLEFTGDVTVTDGGLDDRLIVNIKGGGHSLVNSSGTTMAQEDAMQFADAFLTDDSVNGKTVVENIKEHTTESDYENATEDGIHVIDDGDDAVIGAVSDDYVEVTADGVKTIGTLLSELRDKIDFTKVNGNSYLEIVVSTLKSYAQITVNGGNYLCFRFFDMHSSQDNFTEYRIIASGVRCYYAELKTDGTYTITNVTNTEIPTDGTVYRLYYGNKKAIVDLQTTANRCVTSDGGTVQQALNDNSWVDITSELTWNASLNAKIALYNKALKCIKIKFFNDNDGIANGATYVTLPSKYQIDTSKQVYRSSVYQLFGKVSARWTSSVDTSTVFFAVSAYASGQDIKASYPVSATAYKHIGDIELFVQ